MKQVLLVENGCYAIIHQMNTHDQHTCDGIESNDMKLIVSKA